MQSAGPSSDTALAQSAGPLSLELLFDMSYLIVNPFAELLLDSLLEPSFQQLNLLATSFLQSLGSLSEVFGH